jgi:hypothetical protein
MNNLLPLEIYVVLAGIAVVALAWFLLRFGKTVARWALAFGGLAAVLIAGLGWLENARATRAAVRAATVAGAGASALAVLLALMLLMSAGVVVWLAVRLKLAERGGALRLPPRRKKQRQQQLPPQPEPVIYYVLENDAEDVDALDLADWGW